MISQRNDLSENLSLGHFISLVNEFLGTVTEHPQTTSLLSVTCATVSLGLKYHCYVTTYIHYLSDKL